MTGIKAKRSVFNLSKQHTLSVSPNMFTPIYAKSVLPGETLSLKNDHFCRFTNLLVPIYDHLKMGIYAFYVRNRDVYKDYSCVYGEKRSQRTKDIVYRNPYICTSLAPWYQSGTTSLNWLECPTAQDNPFKVNNIIGPDLQVLGSLSSVNEQLINNVKDLFLKPIQLEQDGNIFNVPIAPMPLPAWNYNTTANATDAQKNALKEAASVSKNNDAFTWHPCGLGDYLYGSVGVKYFFLNAYKALSYYKACDDYCRPADLIDPLFAVDEKHEKSITRETLASYVKTVGVGLQTPFAAFDDPNLALCDDYNEEQIGISIVMAFNYTYPGSFANYGDTNFNTSKPRDFKRYLLYTGGLYPIFKFPDYFGLCGLQPTEQNLAVFSQRPVSVSGLSSGAAGNVTVSTVGSSEVYNLNVQSGETFTPGEDLALSDGQTIQEFVTKCKLQNLIDSLYLAGTRYFEIVAALNKVVIPDNQLGRALLLSMDDSVFDIIPVVQSSGTTEGSTPQGTLTANGVCRITGGNFYRTFLEAGTVLVCVAPRCVNIYQEKFAREDLIFDFYDYPMPMLGRLPEEPVFNYEIHAPKGLRNMFIGQSSTNSRVCALDTPDFVLDNNITDPNVRHCKLKTNIEAVRKDLFKTFGFQERYAYLKYANNSVAGLFRSRSNLMANVNCEFLQIYFNSNLFTGNEGLNVYSAGVISFPGTLDYWTYAVDYDQEILYGDVNTYKYSFSPSLGKTGDTVYFENIARPTNTVYSEYNDFIAQSDTPAFNWTFLLSSVPWKRSSQMQKQQPLEMKCNFQIKSAVPFPTTVVPGRNTI